jgi:hypothetical protein
MQELLKFIQDNSDTIIALCALLVSTVSILIGYFSLKAQQKHNRLSVKPIGKISFVTGDDNIEITIRNDGTGPMLVSNIKVYEDEADIKNNLRDALPTLQKKNSWTVINMGSQFTIGAGEQKTLLKISTDRKTREFRDYLKQVLAALKYITLELEYRDIYDQHIGALKREGFQRPES